MDYLVPTATEVPVIEYGALRDARARAGRLQGRRAKAAPSGAVAAVVNAVADALSPFGVKVNRLPLSPAAVLGLIQSGSGGVAATREPDR